MTGFSPMPEIRESDCVLGFCKLPLPGLSSLAADLALTLSPEDLAVCQTHFTGERREPTVFELHFLSAWCRLAKQSPRNVALTALAFDDPRDLRIWRDICRMRQRCGRDTLPPTLADLLSLCSDHLDRLGRFSAPFPLVCGNSIQLSLHRNTHTAVLTNGGMSAMLADPLPTHHPEGLLFFLPFSKTAQAAQFLQSEVGALLRPLTAVGEEGSFAALVAGGIGADIDLFNLPHDDASWDHRRLLQCTGPGILLAGNEQVLPLLMAAGDRLLLIGRCRRDRRLRLQAGLQTLLDLPLSLLTRFSPLSHRDLRVPARGEATHTTQIAAVGDRLLGSVSATGGALSGLIALLLELFCAGADLTHMTHTAVLTLPNADDQSLGDALSLLLDLHRVSAELALPGKGHRLDIDGTAGRSTLFVAMATKKGDIPSKEAQNALITAAVEGDFAAFRKILYRKV